MDTIGAGFHQPNIFKKFEQELIAIQSSRHGGNSIKPFKSLNLSLFSLDNIIDIQENRRRFFALFNISPEKLAHGFQIHSDNVLIVKEPGLYYGYDAFISNQKGIYLSVNIADCVPILIYDTCNKTIAAIHAGWKGTQLKIVKKTVELMIEECGSRRQDCIVFIGTCIGRNDFEVDKDVAQYFDDKFKKWDEQREKYLIDLKKANQDQLIDIGFAKSQIEISPYSTVENNEDFFSYRKEKGNTGRMIALIGLRD